MFPLILAACAPDLTPAWGFDPIYLEPDGLSAYGFETWQIYADKWSTNPSDRYYVCAAVVELVGEPSTCPDCTVAWSVSASFVESDCPSALAEDPLFTSVIGIGIGEASTNPDAPHPGLTQVGWVDYGSGWEIHGDAWPEILDSGGVSADSEWDGEKAFTFWPGALWPIP